MNWQEDSLSYPLFSTKDAESSKIANLTGQVCSTNHFANTLRLLRIVRLTT